MIGTLQLYVKLNAMQIQHLGFNQRFPESTYSGQVVLAGQLSTEINPQWKHGRS